MIGHPRIPPADLAHALELTRQKARLAAERQRIEASHLAAAQLIAEYTSGGGGQTDEVIAGHLGVSARTVRRVVGELMTELGARSRC